MGLDSNNSTDFVEILKIDRDLSLGIADGNPVLPIRKQTKITDRTPIPEVKKSRPFSFTEKQFTTAELAYWNQYGIRPETLSMYKVCSLREFHSENKEGKPLMIELTPEEPLYGYNNKRYMKIYRPFS